MPRVKVNNPVNRSHPLAYGLGAVWLPVAGRSGASTLFDLLGQYDAPLTGGFAWRAGFPPLLPGLAAFTDGTQRVDGQKSFPSVVFDDTLRASLFVVCRPTASGAGAVWAIRASGSGGAGVAVEFSAGQAAVARSAGDGGSSATATTTTTATVNQWCTVAGTFSALATSPTRTAYLNGQDGTTNTTAVGAGGTTGDRYGTNVLGFSPAPAGGELAAVLFWPARTLAAADVFGLHAEAVAGFPSLLNRRPASRSFAASVAAGGGGGGFRSRIAGGFVSC